MNLKLIFDIFITILSLLWPVFLMISIMLFDKSEAMNSGKVVLLSSLMVLYPILIFLFYTLFQLKFFTTPPFIPLLAACVLCLGALSYLGQVRLIKNYSKGIKSSGYTVEEVFVYFDGRQIEGADPKSFEVLGGSSSAKNSYSRDKNSVYYKNQRIDKANPENFKNIESEDSLGPDASDGQLYFRYGVIYKEAEE